MTDLLTDAERLTDNQLNEILAYNDSGTASYIAARELKELRAQCERMRTALESLLPGLILDLRYADYDDDKDAMQSRIDTVIEALSPCSSGSSSGSDPVR